MVFIKDDSLISFKEAWRQKAQGHFFLIEESIDTAWKFFRRYFSPPPKNYSPARIISNMKGINFFYPVKRVSIAKGTQLIAFKDPRVSPYQGNYFTKHDQSIDILGISKESNLKTNPTSPVKSKVKNIYTVVVYIPEALCATCASINDTWSLRIKNPAPEGPDLV